MKLGSEQIQFINALDSIARVSAKDCFVRGENIIFLVPFDKMSRAIGKNGSTVEALGKKLGKRVELFEYFPEPEKFFGKAFHKAKIEKIEVKQLKDRKIAVISADNANKKIILRNMSRLGKVKELAKRNYGLEEVRIR